MPTLQNIDGRSLVGNTSGLTNALDFLLQGEQQAADAANKEKQQQEINNQIDILTGKSVDLPPGTIDESGAIDPKAGAKRKQAALLRLSALSPTVANSVRQTLERGDELEIKQVAEQTEKGTRLAAFVKKQTGIVGKQRALAQAAQEAAAKGEDVSRFVELSNLPEAELDLALDKMLIQGADLKMLTEDALSAEKGFTLGEGQTRFGPDGKPIASVAPKKSQTSLSKNVEAATGFKEGTPQHAAAMRMQLSKPTGTTVNVGGSAPAPVVTPIALLEDLPESVARKVDATFRAAGGGKDGINAIDKVKGDFQEEERRKIAPKLLKESFPTATPAELVQLEAAMDASGSTEGGLKRAAKIREEQRRLTKAAGFQDRAVTLLERIVKNPELDDVLGSVEGAVNIRLSDSEAEIIADIEEASNILTADNMDLMTGVLSESDIKILKNLAGGGLNRTRSVKRFKGDVTNMVEKLSSEKVKTINDTDSGPKEGQTATNPSTGQKIIFRGGKWQKM